MNAAPALRIAALSGLAIAAAVALWWLGSTRLALDKGSNASRGAADAVQALWLARGMALAVLGLRVATLRGWRAGATESLGLIAPAWPVLLLAWSASTMPWTQLVLSELMLLAACLVLPIVGQSLHRLLRHAERAETVATGIGVVLVAVVWAMRGHWALPLP